MALPATARRGPRPHGQLSASYRAAQTPLQGPNLRSRGMQATMAFLYSSGGAPTPAPGDTNPPCGPTHGCAGETCRAGGSLGACVAPGSVAAIVAGPPPGPALARMSLEKRKAGETSKSRFT